MLFFYGLCSNLSALALNIAIRLTTPPPKNNNARQLLSLLKNHLYAGGFSTSVSTGTSRFLPGSFFQVRSVVVASTSGVSAGPTASQLNPVLWQELNIPAAKAAINTIASIFFISKLKPIQPSKFRKPFFANHISRILSLTATPPLRFIAKKSQYHRFFINLGLTFIF